jgi:acyl-CoA hydrolase
MKAKHPKDSLTIKSELVLPNDTNMYNNLMGGNLMYYMDVVGAICAQRHCNQEAVTASVDNISFNHPIQQGSVVTLKAFVTRAFNTSVEIKIEVEAENIPKGLKQKSNEAFFTFVAIDKNGKPQIVPELIPETEEEKKLHMGALRRRQLRLILAGKIKPTEAQELRALFYED